MVYGVHVEKVNLKSRPEREEVAAFLKGFNLALDQDVDYTLVVRRDGVKVSGTERNPIVGTCSKAKNVLKCFAVREEFQGEGLASTLVSALIDQLFSLGIYHCFVFTKPSQVPVFTALNFKLILQQPRVALLENGITDIKQSLKEMKNRYGLGDGEKAALVMNCNPFTLGHQFLIEEAARNNGEVLVFIVEEERSLFPFALRFELVCRGTAHLDNVKVIPSGEYIISSATFPAYFIREAGEKMKAYTDLDASIFGKYFGKYLNIKKRYVGEEPYCPVTRAYNETLQAVLPKYGVELIELKRKALAGQAISASLVRRLLKEENPPDLSPYLPEVTLEFLRTPYGKEIAEKIKGSHSPH